MSRSKLISKEEADPHYKRDLEILEMARAGKSYQEIGDKFGLTRARVSQICIQNGVKRRPYELEG